MRPLRRPSTSQPKPTPPPAPAATAEPKSNPRRARREPVVAKAPPPRAAPGRDRDRRARRTPAGQRRRARAAAGRLAEVVAYVSRNPANRPLIAACRPIELRDGVIVLGFPENQAFLRDIAERNDRCWKRRLPPFSASPSASAAWQRTSSSLPDHGRRHGPRCRRRGASSPTISPKSAKWNRGVAT